MPRFMLPLVAVALVASCGGEPTKESPIPKAGAPETMEIRRIRADEGLRLRALRLHALGDLPTAYGSTLATEELYPSPFGMREP